MKGTFPGVFAAESREVAVTTGDPGPAEDLRVRKERLARERKQRAEAWARLKAAETRRAQHAAQAARPGDTAWADRDTAAGNHQRPDEEDGERER